MTILDPDIQVVLAQRQEQSGNRTAAERTLREVLTLFPLHAASINLLATLLTDAGRVDEAMVVVGRAAQAAPRDVVIQNTFAAVLANRGDTEKAAAIWQLLHANDPTAADYCHNLGRLAQHQGRDDEAIAWYYKALHMRPASLATCEMLSDVLRARHDFVACGQVLAGALKFFPDNVSLHLRLSYALMMTGQLAAGWEEFEWRWQSTEIGGRRHGERPEWTGQELRGRSILLFSEHGIGDTLQFVRYAAILAERGAKVIVECQPEVKSLLILMPAISAVRAVGETLPKFDYQLPLMSVPRVTGISVATIPATVPYLGADARKIKTWGGRLGNREPGVRRVGIAWAGNSKNPNDKRRSISIDAFAPLARIEGIELHSLQKDAAGDDVAAARFPLVDHARQLTSFEETAALIANLDLVISIDTAVTHLAGAMNRPVWTLLADFCDGRWMAGRTDTPWYPSMRLFRQEKSGDWSGPLKLIEEELKGFSPGS